MFSAEDQQIEICLLKSNLEEIENDLAVQRSAIPALDAENKQKCNETLAVLKVVRSLNSTIEKLKQENICLTAKRVQLKRQCHKLLEDLESARNCRDELGNSLKQEENETELQIRQYEDSLQEKAERFRRTRGYYDEDEINKEIDRMNSAIAELESELNRKQIVVDELKSQAEGIHPEVPEDLLQLCGKPELDEKVTALIAEYETLSAKR